MKIFKSLLKTIALLLIITSCDNQIIDLEPQDRLTADQALNTIDGLEATMFQVFETLRNLHEGTDTSVYKQAGTDLSLAGTNINDEPSAGLPAMNSYNVSLSPNSGPIEQIWDNHYRAIANCNAVIENAIVPVTPQEEATVARLEGQARTMRAYCYLELVRRFDNIPISKTLPKNAPPSSEAPLEDKSVIYDLILNDLTTAVPNLPNRAGTSGVGTPSSGLANFLLSEAYLDLGMWKEAGDAAAECISTGGFSLQPLDGIFGLEGGKQGTENNLEIMLSWVFDPAILNRRNRMVMMLVPLYDRVNGVARTFEQGGRPYGRMTPSTYYFSLFDNEDGRLNAWHKTTWQFDVDITGDKIVEGSGFSIGDTVTPEYVLSPGGSVFANTAIINPACTKTWEDGTYGRLVDGADGYRNVIVYRLSNAYLNAAEAYWKNGEEGKALPFINAIRERAYGNSSHNFTSLTEEDIIEEHARELGFEGVRWSFLKRTGKLIERVKLHNALAAPNIQDKHLRWPIPQTFVDLARVDQNTGY